MGSGPCANKPKQTKGASGKGRKQPHGRAAKAGYYAEQVRVRVPWCDEYNTKVSLLRAGVAWHWWRKGSTLSIHSPLFARGMCDAPLQGVSRATGGQGRVQQLDAGKRDGYEEDYQRGGVLMLPPTHLRGFSAAETLFCGRRTTVAVAPLSKSVPARFRHAFHQSFSTSLEPFTRALRFTRPT